MGQKFELKVESTGEAGNGPLPSGLYVHPATGQRLVYKGDNKTGNSGADAAIRLGFVYAGPVEEEVSAPVSDQVFDNSNESREAQADLIAKAQEAAAHKDTEAAAKAIEGVSAPEATPVVVESETKAQKANKAAKATKSAADKKKAAATKAK